MSREHFEDAIAERNVPGTFERLKTCTVGIVGAGGLGSNVAVALVRTGVGRLILSDPDRVELSNLNRQHFFRDQVGQMKVDALARSLKRVNPYVSLSIHHDRVNADNILSIYGEADLLVEALDRAKEKAEIIEAWLVKKHKRYVVAASGLAGYGHTESLGVRRMGYLAVCGDGKRDMTLGLTAGRVGMVACMQANVAVELLLSQGP